MLLWYTKSSLEGSYSQRPTPSTYKIDLEDLDANTYRSITTGNLIDTVISKNWTKISMTYKCISATDLYNILGVISANPIYVKAMNPLFSGGYIEAEFRCSKKSFEMLETGDYTLSFNLVQKKKVSGQ